MRVQKVPLDTLRIPDYCKREHTQDQIERFLKSFKKHGQYQPIVTSENEILCGTLVYLALKQAGKPFCFINDLGSLPLERKKEIRYLDNQIFDVEDWESEKLKEFLMSTSVEELEKFGFTPEETEMYINLDEETPVLASDFKWNGRYKCENCGWEGTEEEIENHDKEE